MNAPHVTLGTHLRRINRVALAAALGIVALIVVVSSFALGLMNVLDTTRVQAKVVADNASAPLVFDDAEAAQELLQSLRHSKDIEAASLHTIDGKVFSRYQRAGTSRRSMPTPAAGQFVIRPDSLTLSQAVLSPEGEVGRLVIVASLATLYKTTGWLASCTALAMLLALGVSTMLLRRIRTSVLRPLETLNESMTKMSSDADFDVCADSSEISELQSLGQAFNRMIEQIQERDARNAALLGAIPDLLFELDLDGRYLDYHAPNDRLLVAPGAGLLGKLVTEVLPPMAAECCMSAVRAADEHGFSVGNQFQLALDKGVCWFELSVSRKAAVAGQRQTFMVLSRDITAHKAAEQSVALLAYFDSLTGLPNRASFLQRVDREIKRAQHNRTRFGILFVDLDGFKNVNDTLGHAAGDRVLRMAADRLRESVRPSDVVSRAGVAASPDIKVELARLGGDEFTALILDIARPEDCLVIAQRVLEAMRAAYPMNNNEVVLSCSIGIALYPDDGEDGTTLLEHADIAMYHAKDSGRDNCQFYSVSLTERAIQRMERQARLRVALERDEFSLVYQPQVDAASGRISSVEALIRWTHPVLGTIPPLEFIPLAEENGAILAIGGWVLRTACADAVRWQRDGKCVRLAVNLSPLQLKDPDLLPIVRDALASSGLAPELLELEITEGALMEDTAATTLALDALRNLGLRIALDDFGTEYSSLAYLSRMPLNSLKIDRSFVSDLPHCAKNLEIVRAILAMSHSLGLSVTAEGVETVEQMTALLDRGCDAFQGYYFSRPVAASDIPALLDRSWSLHEAPPDDSRCACTSSGQTCPIHGSGHERSEIVPA
ncbi:EAL domain-containing protein [Lysobacter koreensis]|uniref:EAL domain-containing protein n=1 Tax=Lysobacter koreensis TaxID=266122 RepID=A0ABW2YKW9_9GAMM